MRLWYASAVLSRAPLEPVENTTAPDLRGTESPQTISHMISTQCLSFFISAQRLGLFLVFQRLVSSPLGKFLHSELQDP